ncbi:hypothetical protein BpHYR1_007215 [Brachionus plicatilis]|uniref:Uncharacterized protein n=1 Tax=Brachionus plicatilis TaxID=10195 RepID=A0A3M7SQJ0_BRAPC|nr:hypothetical protein BpHYR1_007215 [Brachionus plicatilis]
MDEESNVKKLILDSKNEIQNAVNEKLDHICFLKNMDKSENYISRFDRFWRFAFENISIWNKVVEMCSTRTVEECESYNQQTSPKSPHNSKILSKTNYKIIEDAEIVVEFYNKQVFGIIFF